MSLSARIMNLPCAPSRIGLTASPRAEACYEIGHRDARHAAAELAAEADAIRDELVAAAENLLHEVGFGRIVFDTEASERMRAALARAKGQA